MCIRDRFDTVFNLLAVVPVDVAGVVQVDDVVKEQVRFVVAQDVNGDLHPVDPQVVIAVPVVAGDEPVIVLLKCSRGGGLAVDFPLVLFEGFHRPNFRHIVPPGIPGGHRPVDRRRSAAVLPDGVH